MVFDKKIIVGQLKPPWTQTYVLLIYFTAFVSCPLFSGLCAEFDTKKSRSAC